MDAPTAPAENVCGAVPETTIASIGRGLGSLGQEKAPRKVGPGRCVGAKNPLRIQQVPLRTLGGYSLECSMS